MKEYWVWDLLFGYSPQQCMYAVYTLLMAMIGVAIKRHNSGL